MKPLKFTLIGLVALLAITAGYGCGGGDDSTDGTVITAAEGDGDGTQPSKATYVIQADVICARVPQRYSQVFAKLEEQAKNQGKAKLSKAETNLKAAVPPLYLAMKELEGLTPPSGDEQEVEEIIDALEAATKGLEAKPTSELFGPKSPFAEFQTLTKEYGLKACSRL